MLENWCWDPSILHGLSRYYSYLSPTYKAAWQAENRATKGTAAGKVSLEVLKEFAKARNMRGVTKMRGLLAMAMAMAKFDMSIHGARSVGEAGEMEMDLVRFISVLGER